MKTGKDNPRVAFMGRYNDGEILSGPEKTAIRIFSLHTAKNKTWFIQYFFDGRKYGLIKKLLGKETRQVNENAVLYTVGLFRIIPLLYKLKPDLIHIITYERFAVIAFYYKILKTVKIICNEHGIIAYENIRIKKSFFLYGLKDKFCEWVFLKFSDKIVFPSESSIDMAQQYFKVNESKAIILANGIDEEFHLAFLGKVLNVNNSVKAVILSGFEYSLNGIAFLLNTLSLVDVPVELYVIGNRITASANNETIIFHYSDKLNACRLADFYKDKDVFFSLRHFDTFSIASVEAMAAGLIPIVTEETGMSRFIIDGENGFTVKYDNREKLGNILKNLSASPELRTELSAQSSKIYEILSWQEVYESYNDLYESLSQ